MDATQPGSRAVKPDPEQMAKSPAKPNVKDGDQLEIAIKSQDGSEVKFRVKSHTPFQKVFNAWAKKKAVQMDLYKFLTPDGLRIQPENTPASVGLVDGDSIDAMISQEGGLTS